MKMRKFTVLLFVLAFIGLMPSGYAQNKSKAPDKNAPVEKLDTRIDNMGYWNKMAEKGLTPYNAQIPVKPAEYKGSLIESKGIIQFKRRTGWVTLGVDAVRSSTLETVLNFTDRRAAKVPLFDS